MSANPGEFCKYVRGSDSPDSPLSTEIAAPYYDEGQRAWVLSRHVDVLAAFRSAVLVPTGPNSKQVFEAPDEATRLKMRSETLEALSPEQIREWSSQLTQIANERARSMPTNRSVDLVTEFARPLCLQLAIIVTGINSNDAEYLRELAQPVSDAAAEPYDPVMRSRAAEANVLLREWFHGRPEALREAGFVALSHTMPCLLANSWYALLHHPDVWYRLHLQPDLMAQAVEELLRFAGLPCVLYRRAIEDVNLNGFPIRKGERLILRLHSANRDPDHFSQPNLIDLTCCQPGQLSLGAGPHSCVGASLIRMAMITISRPLLERFARAHLVGAVEWRGGSSFRSPTLLKVSLREGSA